jgi:hypothetical protein
MRLPPVGSNSPRVYLGQAPRSNPVTCGAQRSCRALCGWTSRFRRQIGRRKRRRQAERSTRRQRCLTTKLSGRPTRPEQRSERIIIFALATQPTTFHGPLQRKLDNPQPKWPPRTKPSRPAMGYCTSSPPTTNRGTDNVERSSPLAAPRRAISAAWPPLIEGTVRLLLVAGSPLAATWDSTKRTASPALAATSITRPTDLISDSWNRMSNVQVERPRDTAQSAERAHNGFRAREAGTHASRSAPTKVRTRPTEATGTINRCDHSEPTGSCREIEATLWTKK